MTELLLVGIGTGNPDHLTGEGAAAIRKADLILIPRKGADKADLADLRHLILDAVLSDGPRPAIAPFDMPVRAAHGDYRETVDDWHDAIARIWTETLAAHGAPGRVALLVWGDPSLYDSSLRIAGRLSPRPRLKVIPGITALQALTAAHAIPVNEIGAPFLVTTGRRLREDGWPGGVDTIAVMLDGGCAFQALEPTGYDIWWGAYLGMEHQILAHGRLAEVGDEIIRRREAARTRHGWIMDTYLLRKHR